MYFPILLKPSGLELGEYSSMVPPEGQQGECRRKEKVRPRGRVSKTGELPGSQL